MKRPPRLKYTKEARRDIERCRQFLRRHSPFDVLRRTRELVSAVRRILENPELHPVRKIDRDTGLHLRRCSVAQFVIVYVYFRPDALEPNGLVSVRAVRHASEEDTLWSVREQAVETALVPEWRFLSTRARSACAPHRPLTTYGEITFVPNKEEVNVYEVHDSSR
jgi:plasmid stabilization system protein ParE